MKRKYIETIIALVVLGIIATFGILMKDVCLPGMCPQPPAKANAAVAPETADGGLAGVDRTRPSTPEWTCDDRIARIIYKAGFTGHDHIQAWAIVMRESRGQNLVPGHPSFNGSDWGIWQINRGAHGHNRWWTEANMSDKRKQSRIAYKHLSQEGTYWRPWGLTEDGQLDPTHYGMWSPWHWENWIMAPYRHFVSVYPCKTTPPKKK